jgi:DNA-binding CsgD family transcriptional regulator
MIQYATDNEVAGMDLCAPTRIRAMSERAVLDGDVAEAHRILSGGLTLAQSHGNVVESMMAGLRLAVLGREDQTSIELRERVSGLDGPLGERVGSCLDKMLGGDVGALDELRRLELAGYDCLCVDLTNLAFELGLPVSPRVPHVGNSKPRAATLDLSYLTMRERDVVQLIAVGSTDAMVARKLGISLRTVHAHVRSIFTKLGITTRAELHGRVE